MFHSSNLSIRGFYLRSSAVEFCLRTCLVLLAIGYWLLAIGYWLLAIGYWLLAIGYWLFAKRLMAFSASRSKAVTHSSKCSSVVSSILL
jgi:hypothetical protein